MLFFCIGYNTYICELSVVSAKYWFLYIYCISLYILYYIADIPSPVFPDILIKCTKVPVCYWEPTFTTVILFDQHIRKDTLWLKIAFIPFTFSLFTLKQNTNTCRFPLSPDSYRDFLLNSRAIKLPVSGNTVQLTLPCWVFQTTGSLSICSSFLF